MEIIQTLPVPFYKFKADNSLIEKIKLVCASLEYIKEPPDFFGFVSENFYHKELFEFFDQSIRQIQKIYFNDDLDFPIVDCWANKYTPLHKLNPHLHSNAVICGVYYVTSHDGCCTRFETANPWVFGDEHSNFNLSINKDVSKIYTEITPEEGTLVLFPSKIMHSMKTITNTKTVRYTIAFNTFPSGTISNFKSQKLSIYTKSVSSSKPNN